MKNFIEKIKKKLFTNKHHIIFIMGAPRSGTTWVWGMLTSHPDIISLNKEDFNPTTPSVLNGKRITSETGAFVDFDANFASQIIKTKILKNPSKIIIEKTPSHALHIEKILNLFPEAKIIYLIRDPRAVVSSMLNSNFFKFAESVKDACDQYREYMDIYTKNYNNPRIYSLKYEDLLDHTKTELKKILNFIGAKNNYIKKIIAENNKKSKVNIVGVFRNGMKDSYKKDLTKKQIEYIEKKLGDIIKKLKF